MINIAICDDENVIVNQIEEIIEEACSEQLPECEIDVFYGGKPLKEQVIAGKHYDIIFLDIEMENEDGISAAKQIRKVDENALLIFISSYEKYLMELFQLNVFRFIKKPINKEQLVKYLLASYQKICNNKVYFSFCYKSEEFKILLKDILFFESSGRKILVYLQDGVIYDFYRKLNDVENELSHSKIPFLRIHQSFLVNFHWIKSRTRTSVTMLDNRILPISEDRERSFRMKFAKALGGEVIG